MAFSFGKKYNRERRFSVDTRNFKYYTLNELYHKYGKECIYTVRGVWKNTKSQYGLSAIIATDEFYVNVPKHLTDICLEMLEDSETIECINSGKAGFMIYEYQKELLTDIYYGIHWIDIEN